MTNGEKLNQVFGMPKEPIRNLCMEVFTNKSLVCERNGSCSKCDHSFVCWSKKEYKEPKKIWKKVQKCFLTLSEVLAYIETSVCESDIVSLEHNEWWVLTVKEKEYIPNEESEVEECQQNK